MKRFAPFLWIVLAIGAVVYWADSTEHRSQSPSVSAADDSDSDDSGDNTPDDPDTFHGDPCTVDCSGHQAGYDWAEKHDIDDEDNCGGNSESFIEGCKAYVREQQGISGDQPEETEQNEN
jgi:hypothetical protein